MAEQLVVHRNYDEPEESGLSWPRIIGIAFVIALHAAALMLLLIPADGVRPGEPVQALPLPWL